LRVYCRVCRKNVRVPPGWEYDECPDCGEPLDAAPAARRRFSAGGLVMLAAGGLVLVLSVTYALGGRDPAATPLGQEIRRIEEGILEASRAEVALEEEIDDLERDLRLKRAESSPWPVKLEALRAELREVDSSVASAAEAVETAEEKRELAEEEARKTEARIEAVRDERRREEDLEKAAQSHIEGIQDAIVTVGSSERHVATGFILGSNRGMVYVVTVAGAAPYGSRLACLLTPSGTPPGEKTIPARATVVYRDEEADLALLFCRVPEEAGVKFKSLADWSGGEAAKGDKVYAVGTNVLGSVAFERNVLDGTVSATDRVVDGRGFLQTTIPANPGSLGSPILDQRGEVVGLLVGSVGGLERASAAVPTAALRGALARMRVLTARGEGAEVRYEPPGIPRSLITAAGRKHVIPCQAAAPIQLDASYDTGSSFLPGPDDTLLLWNPGKSEIAALRPGKDEALWQHRIKTGALAGVMYRPYDEKVIVYSDPARNLSSILDAKTGRSVGRLPAFRLVRASGRRLAQPWACYEFSRFKVIALNPGLAFVNSRTGRGFSDPFNGLVLLAKNRDAFMFSAPGRKLGFFTRSGFLPVLTRVAKTIEVADRIVASNLPIPRKRAEIERLGKEIETVAGELAGTVKMFEVDELSRDTRQPDLGFSHVPGTYRVIIGTTVWEIGPVEVKRAGELRSPRHSGGDEPWFHAFLDMRRGLRSGMASPDGWYAVSDTHVFDLESLAPLVELPIPVSIKGFLSSGSTVYAYDRCNRRVVFLDVEKLLKEGARPWAFLDAPEKE
jgi:S1-C subfamily serine protease